MIARVLAALALLLAPLAATAAPLRVMTFNVRYPAPDDGPNRWEARRALLIATIAKAQPDVIGTQELYRIQGDAIVRALPGYAWFGRDRRGGSADEHMGVVYRRDRLRLLRAGDFWLSDTPGVPGSANWTALYPRMVTWGLFETRGGRPRRFVMLDTHLAYRAEDAAVRERSAALILARLPAIAGDLPVVLTADLNATPDSRAYAVFARAMTDMWAAAPVRTGPAATFHAFTGTPDRRIDHVFARGMRPVSTAVLTDHDGAVWPSDHFPVLTVMDLP